MPRNKDRKKQTEATTTGDILADMARDSNIRTAEKSKNLEHAYRSSLQKLEEQIADEVKKGRCELSTLRTSQLHRLRALVTHRVDIESRLSTSIGKLASAYEIASKQVRRGLECRSGELHEALERAGEVEAGDEENGDDDNDDVPALGVGGGGVVEGRVDK